MKLLLVALLTCLSANAHAALQGAPYMPEVDQRFNQLENDSINNAGVARKYAKAVYDVAVQGGSSTSHSLGVTLPAGAVITSILVYVNTAFTDSGAGSVGLQCNGTRDLMDWQDMTTININDGLYRTIGSTGFGSQNLITASSAEAGRTSAWHLNGSISSACVVTATVRSDAGYVPQTAGKFTSIIEYFIR